jgi:hypothetical protein
VLRRGELEVGVRMPRSVWAFESRKGANDDEVILRCGDGGRGLRAVEGTCWVSRFIHNNYAQFNTSITLVLGLGAAIDAYPGCRSPEGADPINRAFRAVTGTLARADLAHGTDLDGIVSRALRQLTQRRLKAESWDDDQVKTLVEDEPGSPDDWLVFLLLSAREQIEPLLDPDHS